MIMKTLSLDLGTDTGWALAQNGAILDSGTLQLALDTELELQRREGKDRTLDIRFSRLFTFVKTQVEQGVTRIVFEDVGFVSTRMQMQLWTSLRSTLWMAALLYSEVSLFCVPVTTLKQFATGNGHAKKPEMLEALLAQDPGAYRFVQPNLLQKPNKTLADHNEVDAIWLARFAMAVDRGERSFLGVFQRKLLRQVQQRNRRVARKEIRRARRQAASREAALRVHRVKLAIKSLGKCCRVFRTQNGRKAVCPHCGSTIDIPQLPQHSPLTQADVAQRQHGSVRDGQPEVAFSLDTEKLMDPDANRDLFKPSGWSPQLSTDTPLKNTSNQKT